MIRELLFGRGRLGVRLPEAERALETSAPVDAVLSPEADVVRQVLDNPVGEAPLERCARGARSAAILISGKDRVAGARTYLPLVVERLLDAGLTEDRIEIVCATGTHARHTPDEVRELVGEDLARRIRFRAHDCDRADSLVPVGRTSRGTPVVLDRGVLEADVRVLTGRITHHYFAGFSGGRKSILPGVAARSTILANHRRVLSFADGCSVHPDVWGGNLLGNPVHEDMVEAARLAGPTWVLNTLLDSRHRIVRAVAGELEQAHVAGCEEAERLGFLEVDESVRLVVASAGGYPYDLNFIQAVKTLFNHRASVAPGGVFVLAAEAAGGVLPGMKRWMTWADRGSLGAAIREGYDLAAHNSWMLRDLLQTVTVILVSRLPEADVRALGLVPARSLDEALAAARPRVGERPSLRVIHHGNVTWSGFERGRIGLSRPVPAAGLDSRAS